MNNYHDIHSWSRQYREERLREAKSRRLERRLREERNERSGRSSLSLAFASVLSLVRGA
jgi:hypothetical protein